MFFLLLPWSSIRKPLGIAFLILTASSTWCWTGFTQELISMKSFSAIMFGETSSGWQVTVWSAIQLDTSSSSSPWFSDLDPGHLPHGRLVVVINLPSPRHHRSAGLRQVNLWHHLLFLLAIIKLLEVAPGQVHHYLSIAPLVAVLPLLAKGHRGRSQVLLSLGLLLAVLYTTYSSTVPCHPDNEICSPATNVTMNRLTLPL